MNRQFELEWKDKDANSSTSHTYNGNIHQSLLQLLPVAYPDCATEIPNFSGFEHLVNMNIFSAANLQIPDSLWPLPSYDLKEQLHTQTIQLQDSFTNTGMSSQTLSISMKPKTLRPPKHGEKLFSVHGSPLGVYKDKGTNSMNLKL